jgi:protein-S-isoprenylcysteine O-methyltransferase Ste14
VRLRDRFVREGHWLFRHRGYLPLLLLPIVLVAMRGFHYPRDDHDLDLVWEGLCLALSLAGLAVRAATVGCSARGTSGRNRHAQAADSLNTTGMYSIVRHPLYVGNYLMWMGVVALPRVWWLPVIVSLAFWLYYERIMLAEEEFLSERFGDGFARWAERTPAFIPRPGLWCRSACRFSFPLVLQREYSGLFLLVLTFWAVELTGDYLLNGHLVLDPVWNAIMAGTTVLCGGIYALKHRTRLLWLEKRP